MKNLYEDVDGGLSIWIVLGVLIASLLIVGAFEDPCITEGLLAGCEN